MSLRPCLPRFELPDVDVSSMDPTDEERELAARIARELARATITAEKNSEGRLDPCSLAGQVRRRFSGLTRETRAAALKLAKNILADQKDEKPEDAGRSVSNSKTGHLIRRLVKRRLDDLRPKLRSAIEAVAEQGRDLERLYPATTVDMRPAGEIAVSWVTHTQMAHPESLTFRWKTQEPLSARAYWELRGPVSPGSLGPVLARGFTPDTLEGSDVGGFFDIYLRHYLPPEAPPVAQRYIVRVLPLSAPGAGPVYGSYLGHPTTLSPVGEFDPPPPEGVGPWSMPAIMDYGKAFEQGPQRLDIHPVSYYRRARLNIEWFRVDSDQPGPGDEEYHIRAFVVDHDPFEARLMGNFGTYIEVEEGDRSEKPLGWKAYADLPRPQSTRWPRTIFTGISVMEADAGNELDEWFASVTEITEELLRGELGAEVREVLQEIRQEIDNATAGFRGGLSAAAVSYLVAAIGATTTKAIIAWVALVIALVGAFLSAGSRDDYYGFHFYTLALATNDASRFGPGTDNMILNSNTVSKGHKFEGTEEDGRFRLTPTEFLLRGEGLPDAAGISGTVRFRLNWEFYDKVSDYW